MDKKTLRLLILEDNPDDAELEVKELEREGFILNWKRVDTEPDFRKALSENPDLIIADFKLPSFSGMAALNIQQENFPYIPLIIVSGTIGEDIAVECMKCGATDYVLKDRLSRLGLVVRRALKEVKSYRDRKEAENALRESEEKYHSILEESADNIYLMDIESKCILETNAALQDLLGYSTEEMKNLSIYDFIAHSKDDIDNKIEILLKQKRMFFGERKYRRKDGSLVDVEVRGNIITFGGKKALCVVSCDITKRKQAEEALRKSEKKYRLLADNTMDCIWQTDTDLIFTYINPSIFPMLGFTPKEWIGSALADHCSKEDMQKVIAIIDKELDKKKNYSAVFEIYLDHKNGRKAPVEIIGKILIDKDNNFKGFQGTTRDISERKKGREELQKKIAELETYYKATIGRESRIIELKQDINALLERLGEKKKYNV